MKEARAALAFYVLVFLQVPATAGTITGRIYLSGESAEQVLISVEGIHEIPAGSPETLSLDHMDKNFVPEVLPILVGSRVEFRSQGMPCRLFSISEGGAFNLMRQTGSHKWLSFDRAGVIQVRCQDHPTAYAYIVVKENPYFALTDGSGKYGIGKIPGGDWTLRVWFDGQVLEERAVNIRDGEIRVDFDLERPQKLALLFPKLFQSTQNNPNDNKNKEDKHGIQ